MSHNPGVRRPRLAFLSAHLRSYAFSTISGDKRVFMEYLYEAYFKRFPVLFDYMEAPPQELADAVLVWHPANAGDERSTQELAIDVHLSLTNFEAMYETGRQRMRVRRCVKDRK